MSYSIQKLNRSTIYINNFNPYIYIFFSCLSKELKIKSVQGGLTISSFIFVCDDPNYNPSPAGKSNLFTWILRFNLPPVL